MTAIFLRENISVVFYEEINQKWGKEIYVDCYTRKIKGIAGFRAGVCKFRGARRNFEKRLMPS
jgi:hypothetical protein